MDGYSHQLPLDQNIVLASLQNQFENENGDDHNAWLLAKNALIAVRKLQNELQAAQADIAEKQNYIEELQYLMTTDELTKIHNRRGFFDIFERELDLTKRGISVGGILIMIDLDNFKAINDSHGHHAGDKALKLVANTLSLYIRKMDTVARLGGDEFIVLFSNTDKLSSLERVQNLARKLNSLILKYEGHRIPIRASLGMEPYGKHDSLRGVLNKADAKMYEEKETRRA